MRRACEVRGCDEPWSVTVAVEPPAGWARRFCRDHGKRWLDSEDALRAELRTLAEVREMARREEMAGREAVRA